MGPAHASSGRRAALLAALALTALGAATWGAVLADRPSTSASGGTDGGVGTEAPTIAFLGDSLTVGVGAPAGRGYAWQTAERLGWPVVLVDGVSGSGYLAPGAQDSPMPERVADVVAAEPDVVVVAGGSNDVFQGYAAADVAAAARTVLAELRAGLPQATVVVLGPFPAGYESVGDPDPVRDALAVVAQEAGLTFVDPRELLAETFADPQAWRAYISEDGLHPNEAGYGILADALAARLETLVG